MTFFIDRLRLNLAMPDTLSTDKAKQVRGVLAVLPELIRDELRLAGTPLDEQDTVPMSSPSRTQINLPEMEVQALVDKPLAFAQEVATAVLKAIYPASYDLGPLLNTPLLASSTSSTADRFEQPAIDALFEALQKRQEGREASLLSLLRSGMGQSLTAPQASQFCRFICDCLLNNLPMKAADSSIWQYEETLSKRGISRMPHGDFKSDWLGLLSNPLLLERLVQILMKASAPNDAAKLLWHMLSDQALAPNMAVLLQQTLQQRDDLLVTLHYLIALSQSNVSAKEPRLSALLRLPSLPDIDPLSRKRLVHIFLQCREKHILDATTTWMTVAQIQRPTEQDKQVLAELERGVLWSTEEENQPLELCPQEESYPQSQLAKLIFWRKLHHALLTLMQTDTPYHSLLTALAQLEGWLTQDSAAAVGFLAPLADEVVLLRQAIQQENWPLDQQDGWLRVSILLKKLRQQGLEGLLSGSNQALFAALAGLESSLMGLSNEPLLAQFTSMKQRLLAQQNRPTSLLEKRAHLADLLTQLALIEQRVTACLKASQQERVEPLANLISTLYRPLLQDHDSAPLSDLALIRYSLILAPALPVQEQAELMSMLEGARQQGTSQSAQAMSRLKQHLANLLINLHTGVSPLGSVVDNQQATQTLSDVLERPPIEPKPHDERETDSSIDLALAEPDDSTAHDSAQKRSLLAPDERPQGQRTTAEERGRHGTHTLTALNATRPTEHADKRFIPSEGWLNTQSDDAAFSRTSSDGARQGHRDRLTRDTLTSGALANDTLANDTLAQADSADSQSGLSPSVLLQSEALLEIAQYAGIAPMIRALFALYSATGRERLMAALVAHWYRLEQSLSDRADQGDKAQGVLALLRDWQARFAHNSALSTLDANTWLDNAWLDNTGLDNAGLDNAGLDNTGLDNAGFNDAVGNSEPHLKGGKPDSHELDGYQADSDKIDSDKPDSDKSFRDEPDGNKPDSDKAFRDETGKPVNKPSLLSQHGDEITALSLNTEAIASRPTTPKPSTKTAQDTPWPLPAWQTDMATTTQRRAQQVVQTLPLMRSKQGVEKILHDLSKSIILEDQYTHDGGLIILWPFFSTLFERLGLLQERLKQEHLKQEHSKQDSKTSKATKAFVSDRAQAKAYALLSFLLGAEETQGYLGTANLIVGYEWDALVIDPIALSEAEQQEASRLLTSAIARWSILKNMPPASFQHLYLQRKAKIRLTDMGASLEVEKHTLDILMQKMPWGLGMVQFPWLEDGMISVDWPY